MNLPTPIYTHRPPFPLTCLGAHAQAPAHPRTCTSHNANPLLCNVTIKFPCPMPSWGVHKRPATKCICICELVCVCVCVCVCVYVCVRALLFLFFKHCMPRLVRISLFFQGATRVCVSFNSCVCLFQLHVCPALNPTWCVSRPEQPRIWASDTD